MLSSNKATATIAVKDLEVSKKFYEQTLGLKVASGNKDSGGITYDSGGSQVFIYQSSFAGTNKATYVSWSVGDELDSLVTQLQGKGVQFEQYDMPNAKLKGNIHIMDGMKAAWFKDPDGNILNLVSLEA